VDISDSSQRLSFLTPFDEWDGKNLLNLPVLIKVRYDMRDGWLIISYHNIVFISYHQGKREMYDRLHLNGWSMVEIQRLKMNKKKRERR